MGQQADPLEEPSLAGMLRHLDASALNAILVEGFKHENYPKIEVFRPSHGRPPQCWPEDPSVIAVASDVRIETTPATWLDLNDSLSVARFVALRLGLPRLPSHPTGLPSAASNENTR
jgi:molybdopterin-guanine dinucleotide biosynthesis protein MobB